MKCMDGVHIARPTAIAGPPGPSRGLRSRGGIRRRIKLNLDEAEHTLLHAVCSHWGLERDETMEPLSPEATVRWMIRIVGREVLGDAIYDRVAGDGIPWM